MKRKSVLILLLILLGRLQSCDFRLAGIPAFERMDHLAGQWNRLLEGVRQASLDPGNLYRMLPAQYQ